VFGVPADLTPLMVASAGFIACSMTGAVFGFCLGLFIDISLYQTLGVSSLVFTAVGYGTGRIRELRDPAHGLAPVAVGAAATAIAAVGFTLLQFLLGVQSPVSLMLLREILLTVVLNTLIALPVYAIMRRALLPFLPEDPRRRRRRAYTTGGLSPISRL
jgi:rod shape-determining protein MreD